MMVTNKKRTIEVVSKRGRPFHAINKLLDEKYQGGLNKKFDIPREAEDSMDLNFEKERNRAYVWAARKGLKVSCLPGIVKETNEKVWVIEVRST